jgi:4-hydroxy-2-oxoheptanedioate aldolase
MLKSNQIKIKLNADEEIFGILNSVPSPVIIEMFAFAGYDFVIIDTEHLLFSPEALEHAIRAAESVELTVFVRVPSPCPIAITRALDAGAQGIVVARISSLKEAKTAIQSCFYPPIGNRGITGGKNTGFGTIPLSEYIQKANQEVMLTLMIENNEGVKALPEIVKLPHIDMILEGALDLSLSMGYGTDFNHINVQKAISKMAQICAQEQVKFCAIPRLPEQLQQWREKGVHAFLSGEDRGIMFKALKQHLHQLKKQ